MKRSPLSKRSQTRRARLERECDGLWQKLIKLIFSNKCAKCGCAGGSGHHIVKRRNHALRWTILNGILLCDLKCHPWAEQNPIAFDEWLRENQPKLWNHKEENEHIPARTIFESELVEIRDGLRQPISSWEKKAVDYPTSSVLFPK